MKMDDASINNFKNRWGNIFSEIKSPVFNELYLTLQHNSLSKLPEICSDLVASFDAHFVTLVANDERKLSGKFFIYYIFSLDKEDLFIILKIPVDELQREVPSISNELDAANWFEREMKDLFGIVAFPNIGKLAVHPDWPEDIYPMLKDFDVKQSVPRVRGRFDFKHVEGEGVFEIPVGPVHAGIIEPGHFRFSVAGEPIINLDAQLYYVHKGTEKIAEGMPPHRVVFLAERISGDSSFSHAIAFCHAIERMRGIEVPEQAVITRTVLLELERLYNHIGDIGAILLDVGFAVGAARAWQLKEKCMNLNEVLTGSRLLRGMASIGGLRRRITQSPMRDASLQKMLLEGPNLFEQIVTLALSSSTVLDRLETTGILSNEDAVRLGIVGIAAMASGIDRDFRRDHPHCAYPSVQFNIPHREEGDVLSRMAIRIDEVRESFHIIEQLRRQFNEGPIMASPATTGENRTALGYVEGWRGEIVHWVMTDATGNIYRWKITDPSSHNWRALQSAVLNNIVPDFPVINKSFNLSYAGNDR
ncbi:MAG: NADH-quinone oxidoreductase subunit C [Bacteroidota bacterium]